MDRSLSTADLPPVLGAALRSWIEVVETAGEGGGAGVISTTAKTEALLRRRVLRTPELEDAFTRAWAVSGALAQALDRAAFDVEQARSDALLALDALTGRLRDARPSARAIGLGQGW